jgi:tRNA-(ms[2]io[6]A)-hydroxylase
LPYADSELDQYHAPPEVLPLRYHTPDAWAAQALAEPLALLGDHAHLERKAASNALELINRWPGAVCPDAWVSILAAVARDETIHLHAVSRLLAARGGSLPRVHRNPYASALHGLVRRGEGGRELLDRLLVSALIEARSCERFELLARCGLDEELGAFFLSLHSSELSHYKVFLHLAGLLVADAEWQPRWREMLDAEATIMASQTPGSRMHSGVAE